MRKKDAKVGTWVRLLRDVMDIPAGTRGLIDEVYEDGVIVAWDLPPDHPLPSDWLDRLAREREQARDWWDKTKRLEAPYLVYPIPVLRDGLAWEDLRLLEVVR
jgi:hypothetical protein